MFSSSGHLSEPAELHGEGKNGGKVGNRPT